MRLFCYLWIYFASLSWYFVSNNEDAQIFKWRKTKRSLVHSTVQNDLSMPKIANHNSFISKIFDNTLILNCKATGTPKPAIKWFYVSLTTNGYSNAVQISDGPNYLINPFGDLDFLAIPGNLPSSYFCSATNALGTIFSRKIDVIKYTSQKDYLNQEPIVTQETTPMNKNEKVVFECSMGQAKRQNEYELIHWLVKIGEGQPRYINRTEGRFSVITVTHYPQLHVRNITEDDAVNMGVKCELKAKYTMGVPQVMSREWTKPKIFDELTKQLQTHYMCKGFKITISQGSTIELPWCSQPITERVEWYWNKYKQTSIGAQRLSMDHRKISMVSERYGNLLIKEVGLADEGFYFPKISNRGVDNYGSWEVRVKVSINVEITPRDVSVDIGDSVLFQCVVTGYPAPNITWLHNGVLRTGRKVTGIDSDPRVQIEELRIEGVSPETSGVYQCVAEVKTIEVLDYGMQSATLSIKKMPPRLVAQIPAVPKKERYATVILDTSSDVELQCFFNATHKVTIDWYIDDTIIPVTPVIVEEISKHEPYTIVAILRIDLKKLASIDENWMFGGMYVAKATNEFGFDECRTLAFMKGVFRIRERPNTTVTKGQTWTLKCNVISSDVPEISWTKVVNGQEIKFPETHLEVESNDRREILIQKVDKAKHEGSYECKANLAGQYRSQKYNVSVAIPPMTIEIPEIGVLYQNSFYETNCNPRPPIDSPWYAWWEYTPSSAGSNVFSVIHPSTNGVKEFKSLSTSWRSETYNIYNSILPKGVPSFLKNYPNTNAKINVEFEDKLNMANITCVVQNEAGILKKSIRIIIAVLEFHVQPPARVNITLGDDFTLDCSPKPNKLQTTTRWSHKHINVYDSKQPSMLNDFQVPLYDHLVPSRRIYRFQNGTLVVKNVSEKDPLEFLCMIDSNLSSTRISKLTKIFLQVPARIMPMLEDIDIIRDRDFNLTCEVFGDPDNLDITWHRYSNGDWSKLNAIKIEGKSKITRMSYTIVSANIEHEGQYRCEAINAFSKMQVSKIVRLAVVAVPGQILYNTANTEARSMTITWKEPYQTGNKPILDYLVRWQSVEGRWERNTTDRQIAISDLRPSTRFNVTISARNSVGLGEEYHLAVSTLEASPDGPVLALRCMTNSSTSLQLSWQPPDPLLQNGPITAYQVCHRRLSTDNFINSSADPLNWPPIPSKNVIMSPTPSAKISELNSVYCQQTAKTTLEFTSLPKFTGYIFRVTPLNSIGMGLSVYCKNRTLEDYPEKEPLGLTCQSIKNTIELTWNPPPQDSINGVLLHYIVRYFRPEFYGFESDGVANNVKKPHWTLSSLVPYSNYSVQVAGVNMKGPGPLSAPLICATDQLAPSAPGTVKAFPYNESCVIVAWTPPPSPNGPIQQYCVSVPATNKNVCMQADHTRGYSTNNICGLEANKEYVFNVTAHNKLAGQSGESARIRTPTSVDSINNIIVSLPRHISAAHGSTVVLDCEFISRSNSMPSWLYYSGNLGSGLKHINDDMNVYVHKKNGSLVILGASRDTNGTFICRLEEFAINYTVSVIVVGNGIPQQPNIYYHNSSISSLLIAWRSAMSPNGPILGFLIKISDSQGKLLTEHDVGGSDRTYNLSGLTCGTKYTIEVQAKNLAGHSQPGSLTIRTLGTRPQWANSSSLLVAEYAQALCFRLGAFLPGDSCPPSWYQVQLAPYPAFLSQQPHIKNFTEGDILPACNNVSGLHPATDYRYTVYAKNGAGGAITEGYARTSELPTSDPLIIRNHSSGFQYQHLMFIAIPVFAVLIIVVVFVLYCKRRQNVEHRKPGVKKINDLNRPTFTRSNASRAVLTMPSSSTNHNRKLPELPSNTYDSGKPSLLVSKVSEEDDDMKPYATYAPTHPPEPLSPSTRAKQGKKGLLHDNQAAYNPGSQAHSYQYPDMVSGCVGQPCSSTTIAASVSSTGIPEMHVGAESYGGGAAGPKRTNKALYSKGYSVGGEGRGSLLPGRPPPTESLCQQDQYRPGGSTWSNTTGSSTKELTQLFHPNYNVTDLLQSVGLREQDEHDNSCSTARPGGNHSTLTDVAAIPQARHLLLTNTSQDFGQYESGSSGDDNGIRKFTQERFPGLQVIEPRFTHHFARQNSAESSAYESVDGPPSRGLVGLSFPQSEPLRFEPPPHPLARPVPHETLTEEDESSNYQNKFVIV